MKLLFTCMLLIIQLTVLSQTIDTLYLNAGDTISLEAIEENGVIRLKKTENVFGENIISFSFLNDKSFGTILKVNNPFSKQLLYKAEIYNTKKDRYIATSILPVYPNVFGVEMWPGKLSSIRLYDFSLKK